MELEIQKGMHEHSLFYHENIEETLHTRIRCFVCKLDMTDGPAYCCKKCTLYVFHVECIKFPKEIQHPCHPEHNLVHFEKLPKRHSNFGKPKCNACNDVITDSSTSFIYRCSLCNFNLDFKCALQIPLVEYINDQKHHLFLFESLNPDTKCDACGCDSSSPIFLCVDRDCTYNIHFHCANFKFPSSIKHKGHLHELSFVQYFREDDTGEYYCDTCEFERNVEHPLYRCDRCNYLSHMLCALSEELPKMAANYRAAAIAEEKALVPAHHQHLWRHDIKKRDLFNISSIHTFACIICGSELRWHHIHFRHCKMCPSYCHKKCLNLEPQIKKPCHDHDLTLLTNVREGAKFECNACKRDCSNYHLYHCRLCDFSLCVLCSSQSKMVKYEDWRHQLYLFDQVDIKGRVCDICRDDLYYTQSFFCVEPACMHALHFKCAPFRLDRITIPQHPEHHLSLRNPRREKIVEFCVVCGICDKWWMPTSLQLNYYCEECQSEFTSHLSCALSEALKEKKDLRKLKENYNAIHDQKVKELQILLEEKDQIEEKIISVRADKDKYAELASQIDIPSKYVVDSEDNI